LLVLLLLLLRRQLPQLLRLLVLRRHVGKAAAELLGGCTAHGRAARAGPARPAGCPLCLPLPPLRPGVQLVILLVLYYKSPPLYYRARPPRMRTDETAAIGDGLRRIDTADIQAKILGV
jgi:hypothetical protein